ncbi:MAG: AraC family transcriptional regulator [Clostridia bacterium]|nr:AraC family transcriptional regulator [Clostridia bacterium]
MHDFFEYKIDFENIFLKYAKGTPSIKEQEYHEYNEFVYFIQGKSFLISEKIQQDLTPGSIIFIPKEHFHQFCISQRDSYERLILGFRETPELEGLMNQIASGIKVINILDSKTLSILKNIQDIVISELSDSEKGLFIRSSLIQFLICLKQSPAKTISRNMNLSPVISQSLSIIDEKYAEDLSIKAIAEQLYVSPSTLSHKFSKEMNISIYRYITKKRLSVAHQFIKNGGSLTNAASISGFNDYSCFYRLYKKYYDK